MPDGRHVTAGESVVRRWLEGKTAGRVRLSPEGEKLMRQHPWPGNFRELFYRLEAALCHEHNGTRKPHPLGLPATDPGFSLEAANWKPGGSCRSPAEMVDQLVACILAGQVSLPAILEQLEKKAVVLAVERAESLRAAARTLGLSHSTLKSKLDQLAKRQQLRARG